MSLVKDCYIIKFDLLAKITVHCTEEVFKAIITKASLNSIKDKNPVLLQYDRLMLLPQRMFFTIYHIPYCSLEREHKLGYIVIYTL